MKTKQPGEQVVGQKKKTNWSTWLLIGIMVLGALIMAYPSVSDWWNSYHSTRAIAVYSQKVESMSREEIDALLEAAREYNRSLLTKENPYAMTEEDLAWYNSLLDPGGTGLIGYVQIPTVKINCPIYHGTEENVLQTAIGHLDWTSLPVGGVGTHAVISGHRGLPRAKLFTDIDRLKEGDHFTITVLTQTITYEIDQIRIVLPEDLAELGIVPDKDYFTLVTCTPYGINTHRLLVRGHRVENDAMPIQVDPDAKILPRYVTIPAVGIPLLFLFLAGMLMTTGKKRPHVTEADLENIDKIQTP